MHLAIQVKYRMLGPFQSSSLLGSLPFAGQQSGFFSSFIAPHRVLPRRYQRPILWDEVTPFVMGVSTAAKFSSVNMPGSGSKEHTAQDCVYHLLLLFWFVFL